MTASPTSFTALPNRHSIRWRLPLTYAGIALLTALALAGLLLFTLRSYYAQREREYMESAAHILARQTERMYYDQLSTEEIQLAVDLMSFWAQARVQIYNNAGELVADSGHFDNENLITVNITRPEPDQLMITSPQREDVVAEGENDGPPIGPPPDDGGQQADDVGQQRGDEGFRYPLPIRRGTFGQNVTDMTVPRQNSDQSATTELFNFQHDITGSLKISEGPAYGQEIVSDVAEKAAIAGVFAVLIAVGAGWIVSRSISHPTLALVDATQQMAQGDLSTRVNLPRRDEFGLLAQTFNAMAERVESTVKTLRQFVADAAHELNTPLTALRTNLELTATSEIPTAARDDLRHALAELVRLEKLTRSLLTLARLESSDTALQRSPIDLAQITRQMYERYASRAEQENLTFALEIPEKAVPVQGDQAQITRVLDNLLDNAIKFTPAGGRVVIGLRAEGSDAACWVEDTGIGIPENELPKLFSRFHRGRNAAAYPGNGLGLVIVKSIVEEHGGQINVLSQNGLTRFTVSLPVDSKG
ncbi:MAG: HAMP domain-containing histidine kinase [Chloroflexi bacterium]|nr:HAMP domain-containing histidine kinase [Chloroflexota bacterium]